MKPTTQRLARYLGGGQIAIETAGVPECPPGGLLLRTEASGLCSGELMAWYMDRKIPHVLGHELAGIVIESDAAEFPVGSRVAPHHHAPCLACDMCRAGQFVHCPTWRATKLNPGGMAEFVAVEARLLADCHRVDDLAAQDAALVEPLACVMKSRRRARWSTADPTLVIGLGVMGLLHCRACPGAVGTDLSPARREWATRQGIPTEVSGKFDVIFVCPGTVAALQTAVEHANPGARIVMFSPLGLGDNDNFSLDSLYFSDLELITSYSCGPNDTTEALDTLLRPGLIRAEQVVSDFIRLDELPAAYDKMKQGEIVKPMVMFT
ncbi:MAG: alcohol dehydrogenase catalytic domain-containing protein [Chthonomonas sp.]|nr:alcohol dehydrogenase catalytic domain-containing protein [Chthonomonas sp.]